MGFMRGAEIHAIDQGAPVAPQLRESLRERIICADLPPGARLSEGEVALAHGVSRQPVREAFIRLAEEGLVEIRPQRGTYVRKISARAVMAARFVREAIEADVTRLVAETADPAVVASLRDLVDLQRRAPDDDAKAFLALDERFHRALSEAADVAYAWRVVEDVKAQMDRVRYLATLHYMPKARLVEQHAAIVDAIAAADPAGAEAAMRAHLRAILTDLPAIAAERAEFFDAAG